MLVNKEDFDKVFDKNNPDYEKDFRILMWTYIDYTYDEIKKKNWRTRLKESETISMISKIILPNYWIVDMKLSPSNSVAEEEQKRKITIVRMLNHIGLLDDMVDYFGSVEKTVDKLTELIDRIIEDQKLRKQNSLMGKWKSFINNPLNLK